jgi:hypothetical protein
MYYTFEELNRDPPKGADSKLRWYKTSIINVKNKQNVIADFTPHHAYLPLKEYHNRS